MTKILIKKISKKKMFFIDDKIIKPYKYQLNDMFDWMNFLKLKSPVIFDIGANSGCYSIFYATKYKNSKIYSFEPVKMIYHKLRKNLHMNKIKNIKSYNFGFFDKKMKTKIGLPSNKKSNRVNNKKNYMVNDGFYSIFEKRNPQQIELKTFDNFIKKNLIKKISFIKIDTEGSEYQILKGAQYSIKKFRPIVQFEYNHVTKKLNKNKIKDYMKFFKNLNYKKFYLAKNFKLKSKLKKNQFFSDLILVPQN